MIALALELMGVLNFCTAVAFWIMDRSDYDNWLFFILSSIVLYMAAARQDR